MKFVLASSSPRRIELLSECGFEFDVIPSDAKEDVDECLSPETVVEILAERKAKKVFDEVGRPTLGADTVVTIDGKILGKPKDEKNLVEMLRLLSGREHRVITGYALLTAKKRVVSHEVTRVIFNELSDEVVSAYAKSGLGMDKAGGYGVQDGFGLVKNVIGSYSNVVGLPIEAVEKLLKEEGL